MKNLKTILVCTILMCYVTTNAQDRNIPLNEPDYNKPAIFSDLPQKMLLRIADAEILFASKSGDVTSVQLTDNFLFKGIVVSKADGQIKSIVLKSSDREGVFLTFTKVENEKSEIIYRGRIMSRNNGDAFEIKEEAGQYFFIKKGYYDLINE